ncbi:MAG: hypothetical protein EOM15_00180, partial [Spirochaetia bacterium]|nr:hypothetical protein [Spirochaetia bacterium]
MIISSFFQMLPILLVTLGGYLLCSIKPINIEDLVRIVADFFLPSLIFISLVESSLAPNSIADMAKSSALVFIILLVLALFWAKVNKAEIQSTVPPLVFMNSGFLGIPLMKLYGGNEMMNLILIFDQVQGIFMFTLGLLIITGGISRRSLLSIIQSPILWAVGLGFLVRILPVSLPRALVHTLTFAGEAASPLAAFTLGVSLKKIKVQFSWNLISGLLIRFLGGLAIGFLVATLLNLDGMAQTVVIVATALPSAVFTSVLPLRYGHSNQFASSMVLL